MYRTSLKEQKAMRLISHSFSLRTTVELFAYEINKSTVGASRKTKKTKRGEGFGVLNSIISSEKIGFQQPSQKKVGPKVPFFPKNWWWRASQNFWFSFWQFIGLSESGNHKILEIASPNTFQRILFLNSWY